MLVGRNGVVVVKDPRPAGPEACVLLFLPSILFLLSDMPTHMHSNHASDYVPVANRRESRFIRRGSMVRPGYAADLIGESEAKPQKCIRGQRSNARRER